MKKNLLNIARLAVLFPCLGVLLLLLAGCPYESKYPLGDPGTSVIDPSIIGTWVPTDKNNKGLYDTLVILQFNRHEYYIESRDYGSKQPVIERVRGYITRAGNEKILNLNLMNEPGKYFFAAFRLEGQTLTLKYASENFIKRDFGSRKEFHDYFMANIGKPGFFEGNDRFTRVVAEKNKE